MELEVVAGGHDGMLVGCSVDLLQEGEHQALRKKYHEKGHVGIIRCVSSGGRYLASGGTDETVQLYDMRKHVNAGTLLHHEASITSLCFHKESHLLSASEDGTICLWRCGRNWDHIHTLAGHKYSVTSISVHPSGKLALSVGKDRTVRTWDLSTGRAAYTLRLPKAADLVGWSPIGDHYILTVGGTLMVYSVESGECTTVIETEKQINSIAFVQDSVVAVGSGDPDILLYSTSTGKLITRLSGHSNRVKGLALSLDSRFLFSVSSDGTIKAWSLPKSLEDSTCMSTVDTKSRLTCITALLPGNLSEGGGAQDTEIASKDTAKLGDEDAVKGTSKRKRTVKIPLGGKDTGVQLTAGGDQKLERGLKKKKRTLNSKEDATTVTKKKRKPSRKSKQED